MSPLSELPSGTRGLVASLPQGRGLAKRLIALGLAPGSEVEVLKNRGREPIIVEVHGAKLALGRGQARQVAVTLLPLSAE